jgi:hypothetical protein
MDLEDISRGAEVGRENDNLGGVMTTIYVAEHPDVGDGNYWPATPADFSEANVLPLASLDITSGDLYKIDDVVLHSGSVDDEQVGDEGARAWMNKVAFDLPQISAEHLGFLSATTNARLVFFVPCNDGNIRIVGNDMFPATRQTGNARTAKKPDDAPGAGSTQEWGAYGLGPALILDGAISDLEALLTA